MKKIEYDRKCITKGDLKIILQAIPILEKYLDEGYRMTLRQLHYQFVANNFLPNADKTYKKICKAMKNGRMGGLIGWDAIEDRTRNLRTRSRWDTPADILDSCANQYHTDYWKNQKTRVEIWIEKDALIGVIENTCKHWDTPYFSCRGYTSVSELHEAALRIKEYKERGQDFKILYCGDHDPSGINMGEAITKMLRKFGMDFEFKRIALNMEQVNQFNLPPNRIKESDRRSPKYRKIYGDECWELDALSPQVLNEIVETAIIDSINDVPGFERCRQEDTEGCQKLRIIGDNFDNAYNFLETFTGVGGI